MAGTQSTTVNTAVITTKKRKKRDDAVESEPDVHDSDASSTAAASTEDRPAKRTKKEMRQAARLNAKRWAQEQEAKKQARRLQRLAAAEEAAPMATQTQAVAYSYNRDSAKVPTQRVASSLVAPFRKTVAFIPPSPLARVETPVARNEVPTPPRPHAEAISSTDRSTCPIATPITTVSATLPTAKETAPHDIPIPTVRTQVHATTVSSAPTAAQTKTRTTAPRATRPAEPHHEVHEASDVPSPQGKKQKKNRRETAQEPNWWKSMARIPTLIAVMSAMTVVILAARYIQVNSSPRCFINTMGGDAMWSERCVEAAATNQLLPCPPGGNCQGGNLVSCGSDALDKFAVNAFLPSSNGLTCGLAPDAQNKYQIIVDHLKKLSAASACHEHMSIRVRSHGLSTESPSASGAMFGYNDFVSTLHSLAAGDADDGFEWTSAIEWLQFAVANQIVPDMLMERDASGTVWIGLTERAIQKLPLPTKCIAQHALVAVLKSSLPNGWILVKGAGRILMFTAGVYWQAPLPCTIILTVIYAIFAWRRWAAKRRQMKADIESAEELLHKFLMLFPNAFHKSLSIRDHVKNQLCSEAPAAQLRFDEKVWPQVTRKVAKDARVGVRRRTVDGEVSELWQWQGPMHPDE